MKDRNTFSVMDYENIGKRPFELSKEALSCMVSSIMHLHVYHEDGWMKGICKICGKKKGENYS